jgi:hypothetical protein
VGRGRYTNSFSLFSIARSRSVTSFSRLHKAVPLTTPPSSKGFFILRKLRYAICVIPLKSAETGKASVLADLPIDTRLSRWVRGATKSSYLSGCETTRRYGLSVL